MFVDQPSQSRISIAQLAVKARGKDTLPGVKCCEEKQNNTIQSDSEHTIHVDIKHIFDILSIVHLFTSVLLFFFAANMFCLYRIS